MKARIKFWAFQIGLLLVFLIIFEVVLRSMGYEPGDMKPKWLNFKPVDSLYAVPDFYTNPQGVLVASKEYFKTMNLKINSEGFRSKEFSEMDTNKKKILFLGDSFTWGMTAKPLDSSFTDILIRETQYEIINTGIPAADPPQYAEIAKKYIPELKPDMVVVMFFAGNDLMKQDRKVIPNEPFYYYTNAGAILADIDGIHFKSAQEAYNYFVYEKYYLHKPKSFFEKIVSKSALLSRLYSVKFRIKEKIEYERIVKDTRVTKKYLKTIIEVCERNEVLVNLVMIPEVKEANMGIENFRRKYANLILDTTLRHKWLVTQNSKTNFNDYPDAHLNNTGHRFYAENLKLLLNSSFQNK